MAKYLKVIIPGSGRIEALKTHGPINEPFNMSVEKIEAELKRGTIIKYPGGNNVELRDLAKLKNFSGATPKFEIKKEEKKHEKFDKSKINKEKKEQDNQNQENKGE